MVVVERLGGRVWEGFLCARKGGRIGRVSRARSAYHYFVFLCTLCATHMTTRSPPPHPAGIDAALDQAERALGLTPAVAG